MGQKSVVVVGAGLAGLCCARRLQRAGHTAHVYEASDGVGGRVRTDIVEDFKLDRGFQVLFTAYPAIQEELDLESLRLHSFDPGAILYWNERRELLADPFRVPSQMLAAATSPLFSFGDKLKVARLRNDLMGLSVEQIFALPDKPLEAYLRDLGFTSDFLDNFIRPFYGGIFLERDLVTSARMFAFVFKMLAEGSTALPENGMGALGQQLAEGLTEGSLRLNSPVVELMQSNGRITGVKLADGQTVEADAVVVATEADVAASLTGLDIPTERRAVTCLYFALPEPLYDEKLLLLFTKPGSLVNNAALLTNIAPSYAPSGQHLLSVSVLGEPESDDAALAAAVKAELAGVLTDAHADSWRLLRVYRIRWAQFAQPAGIWERLPAPETRLPGLVLAGEITVSSSLHGALMSGQKAADIVDKMA